METRLALQAIVCGVASLGCSTLYELKAGPVVGLSKEPAAFGGGASASAGLGFSDNEDSTLGIAADFRMRVTDKTQHVAIGGNDYILTRVHGDTFTLLRLGAHGIIERYRRDVYGGIGPYGSGSLAFPLHSEDYDSPGVIMDEKRRRILFLSVGLAAEYDARIDGGLTAGFGFLGLDVGLVWANDNVRISGLHLPRRQDEPTR